MAVRVWMAKFDAEDRRARGLPIPAEIELYLKQFTAGIIEAGGVTDIFAAAGIDRPDLTHLDEAYLKRLREPKTPNLAVEALRRLVEQTMRCGTRHNVVRQQSYSDRLTELMRRYTNQHLTSAQIIQEQAWDDRGVPELTARVVRAAAAARAACGRCRLCHRDCAACPVRGKCTTAVNGKWGRGLTLLPADQQRVLETRRREQVTELWQQRYRIRAGVEATISQTTRRTGIRRTRFTGVDKTHLGHLFAATAVNIIRIVS